MEYLGLAWVSFRHCCLTAMTCIRHSFDTTQETGSSLGFACDRAGCVSRKLIFPQLPVHV